MTERKNSFRFSSESRRGLGLFGALCVSRRPLFGSAGSAEIWGVSHHVAARLTLAGSGVREVLVSARFAAVIRGLEYSRPLNSPVWVDREKGRAV